MPAITRSALVAYAPHELVALVSNVDAYAEFLPYCVESRVLSREGDAVIARIAFARAGLRQSLTTRNRLAGPHRLEMELVEGPLAMLRGAWDFRALGSDPAVPASRVTFEVAWEIDSRLAGLVAGPLVDEAAALAMDAFSRRAVQLYGRRS